MSFRWCKDDLALYRLGLPVTEKRDLDLIPLGNTQLDNPHEDRCDNAKSECLPKCEILERPCHFRVFYQDRVLSLCQGWRKIAGIDDPQYRPIEDPAGPATRSRASSLSTPGAFAIGQLLPEITNPRASLTRREPFYGPWSNWQLRNASTFKNRI